MVLSPNVHYVFGNYGIILHKRKNEKKKKKNPYLAYLFFSNMLPLTRIFFYLALTK